MKRLILLLLVGILFTGCMGSYTTVDMKNPVAKVSGHDTQYKDVLSIHCRTPMDLVVDIQGETSICESGSRMSFTHMFSPVYSSRSSGYDYIPILIYPKDAEYSHIEGYADSWRVSRRRDSDASWLIQLDRDRIEVDEAR